MNINLFHSLLEKLEVSSTAHLTDSFLHVFLSFGMAKENVTTVSSVFEAVPPVEVLAPNYPLLIMICILIIVIILGNTLSIRTIVSTPILFNQTGYCFINLAIADISIGLFYLPFCIPVVLTGKWYSNDLFCRVMTSTAICTVIVSITSLALVSLDRYICISAPFYYHTSFSKRRVFILLLLTWAYGSALALFSVAVPNFIRFQPFFYNCGIDVTGENNRAYTITLLTCGFYAPLAIIFFCCLRITRISWKARRTIYVQKQATATETANLAETRRQITIAARIFVVILVFLTCWGPFALEMHYGFITRQQFQWQISVAFEFLAKFNSAMNPFVYMITFAPFRHAFIKRYFPGLKKKKLSSRQTKPFSSSEEKSSDDSKTVSTSASVGSLPQMFISHTLALVLNWNTGSSITDGRFHPESNLVAIKVANERNKLVKVEEKSKAGY